VPTYQYACTECGEHLEAVQKFSDEALTTCPNCQGKLRKVFNSVGIVFKGSGFYRNDSRSGSTGTDKPAAAASESSSSSSSSGDSSSSSSPAPAKTESKPAAAKTESSSKAPAASK
jgi:putative FmdB family regulatory protein